MNQSDRDAGNDQKMSKRDRMHNVENLPALATQGKIGKLPALKLSEGEKVCKCGKNADHTPLSCPVEDIVDLWEILLEAGYR